MAKTPNGQQPANLFTGLALWEQLETTDPNFVKPITGKQYKGNSPHPTWIEKQLTRLLGPCGHGYGYSVIYEGYIEGAPHRIATSPDSAIVVRELMHECRIVFWTRDPNDGSRGEFESYGSTRALYVTSQGKWMHDEDAAKKSLTDAIVKAASKIGCAADIFLGRWDDSKYVAALEAEFNGKSADAPVTPAAPPQRATPATANDVGF